MPALEQLIAGGRRDLLAVKGKMLLNRATLTGSLPEKLQFARAAIEVLEPLAGDSRIDDVVDDLGHAFFLAGNAEEHLDRPQAAQAAYSASALQLERAVVRDGRADLADELARSIDHEATLMRKLGNPPAAVQAGRRAVELWERLAQLEGEAAWGTRLADARTKLAAHLEVNGQLDEAMSLLTQALDQLQSSEES
jgi:tetratricopeptide (TPR) repeat protein